MPFDVPIRAVIKNPALADGIENVLIDNHRIFYFRKPFQQFVRQSKFPALFDIEAQHAGIEIMRVILQFQYVVAIILHPITFDFAVFVINSRIFNVPHRAEKIAADINPIQIGYVPQTNQVGIKIQHFFVMCKNFGNKKPEINRRRIVSVTVKHFLIFFVDVADIVKTNADVAARVSFRQQLLIIRLYPVFDNHDVIIVPASGMFR